MSPEPAGGPIVNALTVDVEDYFHVSAFDGPGRRARWDSFECRVEANTNRVLEVLNAASVRATFFVLGWVAERFPGLVRQIAAGGHEIASHSFAHRLVYDMTPAEFREDLRRAKGAIESAVGVSVRGFRAPSFSVTERSLWALDILIEEGHTYDSSIFPILRDRYGLPGAPRAAHVISRQDGSILEVPPSTVRWAGLTLPVAGGGYLRLYPYELTRLAIRRLNEREAMPAVVYLHPWELDPEQPRQSGSLLSRFRHYVNIGKTEARLTRLLHDFAFAPLTEASIGRVPRTVPQAVPGQVGGSAVPALATVRPVVGGHRW